MIFEVQGNCTLRIEADSFEQADRKTYSISGVDLYRITPEYMADTDDAFTFVCTVTDIDREVIRKIS